MVFGIMWLYVFFIILLLILQMSSILLLLVILVFGVNNINLWFLEIMLDMRLVDEYMFGMNEVIYVIFGLGDILGIWFFFDLL